MNSTAFHTTRTAANIEIDAQAERTDDGRFAVSIAVITDGIIAREPWYTDTLDTLTQSDLDTLADEALASFALSAETAALLDLPTLDSDGQPTMYEGHVREYVAAYAPDVDADAVWNAIESVAGTGTNRDDLESAIARTR